MILWAIGDKNRTMQYASWNLVIKEGWLLLTIKIFKILKIQTHKDTELKTTATRTSKQN